LVAIVTAFTAPASAFAESGLSEATIQRKKITQDQVNTRYWINVAIGFGLALITAALGRGLARLYREPPPDRRGIGNADVTGD
jgi:PST family polysaccharide transporter